MSHHESEKYEDPTPHRLKKARMEGNIPRSKELSSLVILLFGWMIFIFLGRYLVQYIKIFIRENLNFISIQKENINFILFNFYLSIKNTFFILMIILFSIAVISIIASGLLGGWVFIKKPLRIDFSRLNPYKGILKIFTSNIFTEIIKTVFKFILGFLSCTFYLWFMQFKISDLSNNDYLTALEKSTLMIKQCIFIIIFSFVPIVGFDVLFQLFNFKKKLKMSRIEIQDENKEHEGNPQLKNFIRQKQRKLAYHRMMHNIKQADVIILNPIHYAVALRYEQNKMHAPILIAKGSGNIAIKIKKKAQKYFIPIIRIPKLAQTIYKYCRIGDYIPSELYESVAKVLTWVYNLKNWKKLGGIPPKKPINVNVPNKIHASKFRKTLNE
ncbi:MAG: flagellar biosynthesis protein FlhB [Wigglesworthia glossinidia]|nr:flagellar biosynthesis protein FlhB [Wigglesworthia glossinidia]